MSKYSKDNENIKGKRMSDWKTVKIGDICEQINGVSYKPADVYDSLNENATVLLRANNIFEDKLNYDELVFVDKKRVSDIQYMKKGDILICASSGSKHLVGKAACLSEDKELTFGAFCKVLRPKTVNPEFIKHYFFSPSYRTEISRLSEGANINNIKAADLDNLTLPLPTESEQKKIAKQLDKCIKIINNQKRSLEKYDLLIKSRFIEMFGDNKYPKISISEMIEGKVPSAKKLFNKTDEIKYIDISSVDNKINEIVGYTEYIFEEAPSRAQQHIRKNDILISTVRPNLKNIAINRLDYKETVASSGFCVLRPKCVPEYLFVAVLQDKFTSDMVAVTTGANYPAIKDSDVLNYEISNPPLKLQQQFASFVQQIDKSKFAVQKSLEKTETLYKSLMQQYFG